MQYDTMLDESENNADGCNGGHYTHSYMVMSAVTSIMGFGAMVLEILGRHGIRVTEPRKHPGFSNSLHIPTSADGQMPQLHIASDRSVVTAPIRYY